MTNSILVACLVVFSLVLAGVVALVILMLRRQPWKKDEEDTALARATRPLVVSWQPLDNVVARLTFTQSLDADRFAIASRQAALEQLNGMLASRASGGLEVTVSGVRLLPSGVEMTVSASRKGKSLLSAGKAVIPRHGRSGRALPILKDARTGKIIEQMKGVRMAKTLSRLGAMSTAVIGAAHIIAGADLGKRLKQIECKMDLLLAYRRIDQMAALERIYTSAKELGSRAMSREDKCGELWHLRQEIRQLRYTWRGEIQHHLMLIENPKEAGWLKRWFTPKKSSDRRIHEKITEGQLQMGLIEYSMRLDQVLAVGSGTVSEYEGSLADELYEIDAVRELLESKSKLISGKDPDLSVEPVVKAMSAIVEQYRDLLPDEFTSRVERTALPEAPEIRDLDDGLEGAAHAED